MAKLHGKLWLLVGMIAIGLSIALSFLSHHRELYERSYPGDEGGRGFLFTLLAIAILNLGLVLIAIGAVIYVRNFHGNSLIHHLLSVAAALFCGFTFWRAVLGLLGGLRAGLWPLAIAMIAGVVSYVAASPSEDI
jgi:hypothetical protein